MAEHPYFVLALLPVIAVFAGFQFWQWRYKKYAHIPNLLPSNLFLGHMGYIAAGFKKLGNSKMHPGEHSLRRLLYVVLTMTDYVFEDIWRREGRPELIFFDARPVQYPVLLITSHEGAEQLSRSTKTRPYGMTKSPTVQEGFGRVIGRHSMLSENGERWKGLRKTFNSGFAPAHLLTLLPIVNEKTQIFVERLDKLAKSGVATEMEPYCTDVTFDIISEVVNNIDCHAQDESIQGDEIVKNFRYLIATYLGSSGLDINFLNIPLHVKRYVLSKRLDNAVKKCITDKYEAMKADKTTETKGKKDRSVLALALKEIDNLTPLVLQSISDQIKTFLLAGHDTTSILLQRLFYALSIHPECLAKIRAEHDTIFGDSDVGEIFVARPDETMKALAYTSACIKEALRLWPPAGAARMSHDNFKFRTLEGEEIIIDNVIAYVSHHILHRDPKVYGERADDFIPERWLDDVDTSMAAGDQDGSNTGSSKIPASAWRVFERGPRNCIGQELANIEVRVILAFVMRRYDFVKVGLGEVIKDDKGKPIIDEKGKYKTNSEVHSVSRVYHTDFTLLIFALDYSNYIKAH